MIIGSHTVMFSGDPEADRRFFADIGSAGGHRAMAKAVVSLRDFRRKYGSTSASRIKSVLTRGLLGEIECAPVLPTRR